MHLPAGMVEVEAEIRLADRSKGRVLDLGDLATQRILLMIAAGIGAAGTVMPWLAGPLLSVSGADLEGSDGYITMALFLIGLALVLLGDRSRTIGGSARLGVAVIGAICAVTAIANIIDIKERFGHSGLVHVGIGLYTIAASGVALGMGAMAFRAVPDNAQATAWQPPPPPCSRCGASLVFVPEYQRLYCRNCSEYA